MAEAEAWAVAVAESVEKKMCEIFDIYTYLKSGMTPQADVCTGLANDPMATATRLLLLCAHACVCVL